MNKIITTFYFASKGKATLFIKMFTKHLQKANLSKSTEVRLLPMDNVGEEIAVTIAIKIGKEKDAIKDLKSILSGANGLIK